MDIASLAGLLHETAEHDTQEEASQAAGRYMEEILHVGAL